jgi:hypothetical protein
MFMHEIKSRTFLVKLEETCVISSKWYWINKWYFRCNKHQKEQESLNSISIVVYIKVVCLMNMMMLTYFHTFDKKLQRLTSLIWFGGDIIHTNKFRDVLSFEAFNAMINWVFTNNISAKKLKSRVCIQFELFTAWKFAMMKICVWMHILDLSSLLNILSIFHFSLHEMLQ